MKQIPVGDYIKYVEQIYNEKPSYQLGHDGSDGTCDCIGMCKGAIRRAGGDASGLPGTNYAARNTIKALQKIPSVEILRVGDVVLKGRQPGSSGYDLPEQYRKGSDLTDYYHIGTVTEIDPLCITHMTAPTAKKDNKLGGWNYFGQLPQVNMAPSPEPEPEPPEPEPGEETAIVTAEHGSTVNLRAKPSKQANLVDRVPIGSEVTVIEHGDEWCKAKWQWKTGWMMTQFLLFEDEDFDDLGYTITIFGLSKAEAESLKKQYPDSEISVG